jgi:UDP-N-acetylmuramate dehydrogenase
MSSIESLARDLRLVDGVRVWSGAPLAPFTTIGTGGKAALLVTVEDTSALIDTLRLLGSCGCPWTCLGAGSNLLVADRGYAGTVVKLDEGFCYVEGLPHRPGTRGIPAASGQRESHAERADTETPEAHVILTAGGGAYLARLSAVAAEVGLSGLEFACGIPGSVGGGVAMNAGAHGWSLADVVEHVEVASASGLRWIPGDALEWGYRYCRLPEKSVVTAARLRLTAGDPVGILEHHRSLLRERRASQPRTVRTFGSVFKNPPGDAAGRLLEAAGLKGVRRGGAEVSTVHANFMVNLGDATTADVLALMSLMRQGVQRTSGFLLEPEVKLLGAVFPWEPSSSLVSGATRL